MTHQKTKWWDPLLSTSFCVSVGQNLQFFSVGQMKKGGVTQLGLSVFVFLHILDDTKHPKNPDPSYGNTRPSTPGALKTGVNLIPHDIPWSLRANWIPSIQFTQDFIRVYLVGGFNPFEKNMLVKMGSFSPIFGVKIKIIWVATT